MNPGHSGVGFGKIILLGEHAVVYGHPALAAGLQSGVTATVTDGTGNFSAPSWQLEGQIGDDSLPGQAILRLCEYYQVEGSAVDVWLASEIPARAGLGSSAAMATALARALASRTQNPKEIQQAVALSEGIFHRTPSGIDSAAAFHGGLGRFTLANGWTPLPLPHSVDLCIGLSGEPHDTGAQVEKVRRRAQAAPATHTILADMGQLASDGEAALLAQDLPTLGHLFDLAHGLLGAVGVSTLALDQLVYSARASGALGAKLTGAGGGGAVIALASQRGEEIVRGWREKGYYGFCTTLSHV